MAAMTADQFKAAWLTDDDVLLPITAGAVADLALPPEVKAFLVEAGLPRSAAPYLTFFEPVAVSTHPGLQSYARAPALGCIIGTNGSGDLIVVATDGRIFQCRFGRSMTLHYVNRSLPDLCKSLLDMRTLVALSNAQDDNVFTDGRVPVGLRQDFAQVLANMDPAAIAPGAFWHDEMSTWSP